MHYIPMPVQETAYHLNPDLNRMMNILQFLPLKEYNESMDWDQNPSEAKAYADISNLDNQTFKSQLLIGTRRFASLLV